MGENLYVGRHKGSTRLSRLNWQRTFSVICDKHPSYKALQEPTNDCPKCRAFWEELKQVEEVYNI